ncbi:hypothetical protein BJ508DRAFT_333507 [Ascobolus immersus RN42]|uniref:F-box domain-containing protein n=1 Tax=Ascobolus immersus RN42 TaxID=1160509 RepID=A0A3N4HM52_ASCIM|nr:hypothetical protein BJ508DRAFT_333507 [Ascobolus immersus RN42]
MDQATHDMDLVFVLPMELCHAVLSYLPDETLVLCTRVSKPWKQHIESYCVHVRLRQTLPAIIMDRLFGADSLLQFDRYAYFHDRAKLNRRPNLEKLSVNQPTHSGCLGRDTDRMREYQVYRAPNNQQHILVKILDDPDHRAKLIEWSYSEELHDLNFGSEFAEQTKDRLSLENTFRHQVAHSSACEDCCRYSMFTLHDYLPDTSLAVISRYCDNVRLRDGRDGFCKMAPRRVFFGLDLTRDYVRWRLLAYETGESPILELRDPGTRCHYIRSSSSTGSELLQAAAVKQLRILRWYGMSEVVIHDPVSGIMSPSLRPPSLGIMSPSKRPPSFGYYLPSRLFVEHTILPFCAPDGPFLLATELHDGLHGKYLAVHIYDCSTPPRMRLKQAMPMTKEQVNSYVHGLCELKVVVREGTHHHTSLPISGFSGHGTVSSAELYCCLFGMVRSTYLGPPNPVHDDETEAEIFDLDDDDNDDLWARELLPPIVWRSELLCFSPNLVAPGSRGYFSPDFTSHARFTLVPIAMEVYPMEQALCTTSLNSIIDPVRRISIREENFNDYYIYNWIAQHFEEVPSLTAGPSSSQNNGTHTGEQPSDSHQPSSAAAWPVIRLQEAQKISWTEDVSKMPEYKDTCRRRLSFSSSDELVKFGNRVVLLD